MIIVFTGFCAWFDYSCMVVEKLINLTAAAYNLCLNSDCIISFPMFSRQSVKAVG
jgi:hypothetical protein